MLTNTLTLATGALYPIHYQPHTRLLVAGGAEKEVWIWTTDTDNAATLVCDNSGDTITREEWAKYVKDREHSPPCPRPARTWTVGGQPTSLRVNRPGFCGVM